ncbi:MAG: EF hand/EF-hand domain pair [Rhodobacteraceae bacterium HLUCCA12]|nr:MAG: EF hand/EF-hand domain pair [Rhodobacteraceae bacterium HLUCCA12]
MKLATATAIALLIGTVPALAQDGRGPAVPMMPSFDFSAADANDDGAITRMEWGVYVAEKMAERREELFAQRAGEMIEDGDEDGDGALDQDELATVMAARFATHRERMAEARAERDEREERGWRDRGPRSNRERAMRPQAFAEQSFRRLDANDDDRVSAEEFAEAQELWEERAARRRAQQDD